MPKKAPSPQSAVPNPEPLGLDVPKTELQHGRQSAAPICPYCSKRDDHGNMARQVRCVAGSSSPMFTYYYCPTEGCAYSEKKQRPRLGQAVLQPDEDFSARP